MYCIRIPIHWRAKSSILLRCSLLFSGLIFFPYIFRYHFLLHYPNKLHWNYLLVINWNNENDFMRFIVFFVIWWALILNNIVEIKLPIASNYINSVHCSNKAKKICFLFLFKVIPVRSCVRVCASICFSLFFCFEKFVIWF